jgi:hypothetical protein
MEASEAFQIVLPVILLGGIIASILVRCGMAVFPGVSELQYPSIQSGMSCGWLRAFLRFF